MSGYSSKQEVINVIKQTIETDHNGTGLSRSPRDYNIAGIVRDAFYERGAGYGWGANHDVDFAATLRKHLRKGATTPAAPVVLEPVVNGKQTIQPVDQKDLDTIRERMAEDPNRWLCDKPQCRYPVESNPSLYMSLRADGSWFIEGVGDEGADIVCEGHGHTQGDKDGALQDGLSAYLEGQYPGGTWHGSDPNRHVIDAAIAAAATLDQGALVDAAREAQALNGVGKTYDHEARPDDDPEPGDRCKNCGEAVTWIGPSQYDWLHVDDVRNQ